MLVAQIARDLRQVRLRVGNAQILGLRAIDRVAEAPATDCLEAGAVTALRLMAGQAAVALPAGSDRADEHAVTHFVVGDAGSELSDHSDRLVADDESGANGIFSAEDVNVRPADRCQRQADDRLARAGAGSRHLADLDLVRADEDVSAHGDDGAAAGRSRNRTGEGKDTFGTRRDCHGTSSVHARVK